MTHAASPLLVLNPWKVHLMRAQNSLIVTHCKGLVRKRYALMCVMSLTSKEIPLQSLNSAKQGKQGKSSNDDWKYSLMFPRSHTDGIFGDTVAPGSISGERVSVSLQYYIFKGACSMIYIFNKKNVSWLFDSSSDWLKCSWYIQDIVHFCYGESYNENFPMFELGEVRKSLTTWGYSRSKR